MKDTKELMKDMIEQIKETHRVRRKKLKDRRKKQGKGIVYSEQKKDFGWFRKFFKQPTNVKIRKQSNKLIEINKFTTTKKWMY